VSRHPPRLRASAGAEHHLHSATLNPNPTLALITCAGISLPWRRDSLISHEQASSPLPASLLPRTPHFHPTFRTSHSSSLPLPCSPPCTFSPLRKPRCFRVLTPAVPRCLFQEAARSVIFSGRSCRGAWQPPPFPPGNASEHYATIQEPPPQLPSRRPAKPPGLIACLACNPLSGPGTRLSRLS